MALERLYGPANITNLSDVHVTDVVGGNQAFWDDDIGLSCYSTAMAGTCVIQMDGTICRRSSYSPPGWAIDLQTKGGYLAIAGTNQSLVRYLKAAGTIDLNETIGSGGVNWSYSIILRTADRYIQVITNTVRAKLLASSTTGFFPVETTLSLTRSSAGNGPTISRMPTPGIIAIIYNSGEIVYYDVVSKVQLARHDYIDANVGGWYSLKHGVFVAIHSGGSISVYSTEVKPAFLSDVTAPDGLILGKVCQVEVQLLGDEDEPCVNELIEWSVTSPGVLVSLQSRTNSEGVAVAKCAIPPDSIVGASIDVTATATF